MTDGSGYKRLPGAATVLSSTSSLSRRNYILVTGVLAVLITLFVYYRATAGVDYKLYYTLLRAVPSQVRESQNIQQAWMKKSGIT